MYWMSASRPLSAKMPASFATYVQRKSADIVGTATLSATGVGFPEAVAVAAVDRAVSLGPPHATRATARRAPNCRRTAREHRVAYPLTRPAVRAGQGRRRPRTRRTS